ncbi:MULTISPECIES: GNAT family N-acetyltransferase [unclassified Clostridium]|uniref:GNAT family N-acetyltransferase n=1 Tax=unclassified Clostridium TaxID=2614128 RepID=UPI000298117B|nr:MULTISPECIES: GNAT family N-acetyltransferase [unclassified Clostridium]EKQ57718.1 MAG: putative acetyltransferase [Clostridium sp. Maddingley MBC34-26]
MEIKTGVNKFYIGDTEGNPLAQIILTDIEQDIIEIEHTYVYEQLKGKGAGKQLVKKVVEFAMSNNKKIIPICSFARKEFEKNKEYECVLYK